MIIKSAVLGMKLHQSEICFRKLGGEGQGGAERHKMLLRMRVVIILISLLSCLFKIVYK